MTFDSGQGHHHNSAASSLATGVAVGAAVGWLLKNERHPILFIISIFAALGSPLLVFMAVFQLEEAGLEVPTVLTIALIVTLFLLVAMFPARVERWEDRRRVAQARAVETDFRNRYRVAMAQVASEAELSRLDYLWDESEMSYEQRAFFWGLVNRWCEHNPSKYPSQDDMRAQGLLCRCEPADGHVCLRLSGVSPKPVTRHQNPFDRFFLGALPS